MFAGFDFGTSNSAIGVYEQATGQSELSASFNEPTLLELDQGLSFIPSTLYALDRSFVADYLAKQLPESSRVKYCEMRTTQLNQAQATQRMMDIREDDQTFFFGSEAIEQYIDFPEDGVFIKSPKSFLGTSGLSEHQFTFFEDLVSAMMLNVKLAAEKNLSQPIEKVVIGRPVNFQGIDSEKSNQQATDILYRSAKLCGYREIEFLFEPLAAGIDFETQLSEDKRVLVVDIGGGTTDCSMVNMGPSFVQKQDRSEDFLAHTGQRIGGNDIDIHLAFHQLMPLFGHGTFQSKGIEIPKAPFWSAVSINHVGEQSRFASLSYARDLKELKRDAKQPELIERLIQLQATKLNHRLVRSAESAKIQLSENQDTEVNLDYIEEALIKVVDINGFENAIERPLKLIQKLIAEAVNQAGKKPDLVYITGGSAKSPTVRNAVNQILPGVAVLDGDYYGSVATGLTKWARRIWR